MSAQTSQPDEPTITEAYTYLLGRALVIRQEHTDLVSPGFAYNGIKYNPLGSADFVNPNFDVAYLEAWFAVDEKTPVLLDVPEIKGRYYTAQILDEWGEVIANINERTFPSKPFGTFLLSAPGSTVPTPTGAGRIELHSKKAKMLARVELKDDPDAAVRLQKTFLVTATGSPSIAKPVAIPMFDNKDLIGVEIFDHADAMLASALDVAPNAAMMQQQVRAVAAYVTSDRDGRTAVDALLRRTVIPDFQVYAHTKLGPVTNGWMRTDLSGHYGASYSARTAANLIGIWANATSEAVYYGAVNGPDGRPLDGGTSYIMHFPANALPETVVNAYWSIILVNVPDFRVVPNPLQRYNFNNYSALKKEADGSLKIGIGPKPVPGVPESNWLPSAAGQQFALTFRTYVPKAAVMAGWAPPALVPVK
jgi:hypothetical protein